MTPTHSIGFIVVHSEGAFLAVVCPHPPLLVDPFIFLQAYIMEEDMNFHRVFRAKVSLRSLKVSGGKQSAIG